MEGSGRAVIQRSKYEVGRVFMIGGSNGGGYSVRRVSRQ